MLPLQIFFLSAGIALTTYISYITITSWINRWKQNNTSKFLIFNENSTQLSSVSTPLYQDMVVAPILGDALQNDFGANPSLTANTNPEFNNKAKKV